MKCAACNLSYRKEEQTPGIEYLMMKERGDEEEHPHRRSKTKIEYTNLFFILF